MGYERLNLKTGQVITEEVFAHLEDGIEGAANAVLMTPILYADLVALRDAGQLKAGMFYRITDYVTTTVQENTQSAGHAFDVIVLATDSQTLSEEARAIVHEGDTYFTEAGANLAAWKVWYCLDNDSARFAWADAENGKGVIYRLIDEWGNDCPYDFKNIQFNSKYTFGETDDLTGNSKGNFIGVYYKNNTHLLNNNTFGNNCSFNSFGNGCNNNSFGNGCNNNSFGDNCNSNSFSIGCSSNSFGDNCNSNSFGIGCSSNSFGDNCNSNSFGNACNNNSFGNACNNNSFQNAEGKVVAYAEHNSFGNSCSSVTLQNEATASATQRLQNYRIANGMTGKVEVTRGLAYETTIALATDGTIKKFNLADLAN